MKHATKTTLSSIGIVSCALLAPAALHAEFTLNFQRISGSSSSGGFSSGSFGSFSGTPYFNCNRPDESPFNCGLGGGSDPDKTPFLQELVSEGGKTYYHLIIGLPGEPFAQETFIGTGGGSYSWADSASGGQTSCMCSWSNLQGMSGNGWDPLRANAQSYTGNATGDPKQTLIRQTISSPEMTHEFLKDKYAFKPKITQDIDTSELTLRFIADMRNSDYSTDSTAGIITNTLTFKDPLAAAGNFNSMTDATPGAHVTAGRFKYNAGSSSWSGSSPPTYSYVEAGFDAAAVNWASFRDPSQNFNLPKAGNSGKSGGGGGGGGGGGWGW